jgi:hypothetical protein
MMHRYQPPRPPANSHLRYFNLLTADEQARSVRRLLAAGHDEAHIQGLTGLAADRIRAIIAERVYWRDEPR